MLLSFNSFVLVVADTFSVLQQALQTWYAISKIKKGLTLPVD